MTCHQQATLGTPQKRVLKGDTMHDRVLSKENSQCSVEAWWREGPVSEDSACPSLGLPPPNLIKSVTSTPDDKTVVTNRHPQR